MYNQSLVLFVACVCQIFEPYNFSKDAFGDDTKYEMINAMFGSNLPNGAELVVSSETCFRKKFCGEGLFWC